MLKKPLSPFSGFKQPSQPRAIPAAPPPYRPQPTPRVLQTKQAPHAKQPLHKGPVAPQVYRPNPSPQVLQRRTVIQPAKPPEATPALMRRAVQRGAGNLAPRVPLGAPRHRPPAQMKAAVRPPQPIANANVVQRVVVIKRYGNNNETRTFDVKKSNSPRTRPKSADFLIDALDDAGLAKGWVTHLRNMVADKPPTPNHEYDTLKDLLTDLAKTFPLMDESKKRKREEKNQIQDQHKINQQNVSSKYESPGKKLRRGSLVGMNKLTQGLSESKAFKQNMSDLTGTSKPTDGGGKSLVLNTGNIFQSQLALSLAHLNDAVKGAFLEGNYNRVNDGLGASEGIRQDPFIEIPTRLKRTVVYGEGAYKPGETVRQELATFEHIRLGENTAGAEMRHMLVEEGSLSDEFTPVGPYALSEIPGATKGEQQNNRLMNQNSFLIFEEVKTKVDNSRAIGRNAKLMPKGTNLTTISGYSDAFKRVRKKHTKETQNQFHVENFRLARAAHGPFVDEKGEQWVPSTPPGSPFDPGYGYDK